MVKSVVQMVAVGLAEHVLVMKPVPLTNLSVIAFRIVQPAPAGQMVAVETVNAPAGKFVITVVAVRPRITVIATIIIVVSLVVAWNLVIVLN